MTHRTNQLSHAILDKFVNDGDFYQTQHDNVVFTYGVKCLADEAGAHWLIDAIISHYGSPQMMEAAAQDSRLKTMQIWRLDVDQQSRTATLSASADSSVEPFIVEHISGVRFPLDYVEIWATFDGTEWELHLPSEH